MKYNLFTIYDEVTEVYNLPFAAINEREAIRNVTLAAQDPNSSLNRSAEDYSLYHVGTYDDQTAIYENIQPVRLVVRISTLIRTQAVINEIKQSQGEN